MANLEPLVKLKRGRLCQRCDDDDDDEVEDLNSIFMEVRFERLEDAKEYVDTLRRIYKALD